MPAAIRIDDSVQRMPRPRLAELVRRMASVERYGGFARLREEEAQAPVRAIRASNCARRGLEISARHVLGAQVGCGTWAPRISKHSQCSGRDHASRRF